MARERTQEGGFTLVELVISGMLVSVVVLVVGGILVSSYRAESVVRSVTTSTTDAQLAVNVMESTIRNASAVRVSGATGGSQLAQVRVVSATGPSCVSWYYHAPTEAIYERRGTSAVGAPSESAVAPSGWTLLIDGVTPAQGSAVLVEAGGQGLGLRILKSSNDTQATVISTTVTGRVPPMESSPTCFN